MSKRNVEQNKHKGEKRMAILTAKCDQPFIVASDKTAMFKKQKCNDETFKKINKSAEKLLKHLKVENNIK